MFYTEREYGDFIQKTKVTRNLGHILVVLIIVGTFVIGFSYGFLIQNIFNPLSVLWYFIGLSSVLLTIYDQIKKISEHSYVVISPQEWFLTPHLPAKFWLKNQLFISIDKNHLRLQTENDLLTFSYPLLILFLVIAEFIYVVVPLTLYLVRPYDLSFYTSSIASTSPIALVFIIIVWGTSILLFKRVVLRRLIHWTLTKQATADVQLNIRNANKKPFNGRIPISNILASMMTEHTRREILAKNIFGRSYMKRMRQEYLETSMYSLEVAVPMSNTKMALHENIIPGLKYFLLQNKSKDVVEDVQKILSVWVQN